MMEILAIIVFLVKGLALMFLFAMIVGLTASLVRFVAEALWKMLPSRARTVIFLGGVVIALLGANNKRRMDFLIYVVVAIGSLAAIVVLPMAMEFWRRFSSRTRIIVSLASISLALLGVGIVVAVFQSLSCEDTPQTSRYTSPSDWLVDRYGVGHSIGDALGRYSILLLYDDGSLPAVSSALVASRGECSWKVARVYRNERDPWLEPEKYAESPVLVTHWFLGVLDGHDGAAVVPYGMDSDRWSALRGTTTLPCAVCFLDGALKSCPSMLLRSRDRESAVNACAGARND